MKASPGTLHGVLVVDKPAGPTSHDVVDVVRRALRERRVGHTGTLDPFATGVLPVCVGRATRVARFLSETEKSYEGTVRFGFATTTDDARGEPKGAPEAVTFTAAQLQAAALALTGEVEQLPPSFSAKRKDGVRAYELARRGADVPLEPCRVHVHELRVSELRGTDVDIAVRCSAGTYIRSIARDLGARLGVGAHLRALRRTASGGFTLEDAVSLDALRTAGDPASFVRPLAGVLPHLPSVTVTEEGAAAVRHGRSLDRRLVATAFPDEPWPRVRVLDLGGVLLALAVPRGFGFSAPGLSVVPTLHPDVVLVAE